MNRLAALALALLLVACSTPPPQAPPPQAPAPQAPAPHEDINARFLDPDLDVAQYTETFESESRSVARRREAIADAAGLEPGMAVADIGAGTGLFLEPFAARVGPAGRIYAVELSPVFRGYLAERARRAGLADRVQIVAATATSSQLPEGSIDVAFVCDTYHHFAEPAPTLASLRSALRPGGALVIVDFDRIPGQTPEWVLEHVRAGKAEVIHEIEAAGFALERELLIEGLEDNYVLRFRRL
jgi:ubiquinone/menaquinone biosynthesis C-methylase UbiE